jgi:hypothetical protein
VLLHAFVKVVLDAAQLGIRRQDQAPPRRAHLRELIQLIDLLVGDPGELSVIGPR